MTTKSTDATVTETQAPVDGEPRKLLLGKRVVRHFHVKTSIQTGADPTGASGTRLRCYPPSDGAVYSG